MRNPEANWIECEIAFGHLPAARDDLPAAISKARFRLPPLVRRLDSGNQEKNSRWVCSFGTPSFQFFTAS
jgi:hypothetical protein